jgi:hypothetical protein
MTVVHSCNPCFSGGRDQEDHGSKPAQGKIVPKTLSQKYPTQKRDGGVAQVVEGLLSMSEALIQTPVLQKKRLMELLC